MKDIAITGNQKYKEKAPNGGHTLPTLFKASKLFHVGGDEFVAIVKENLEKTMEKFDQAMYENKKYLKEKYNMKGR